MRIWLNGKPLTLVPGMKVREALIQAGLLQDIKREGKFSTNGATKSAWTERWKMDAVTP